MTVTSVASASPASHDLGDADTTTATARAQRAAARRLQGRSRSVWTAVAVLIAAVAAVLLGLEAVLFALGRPPALVAPDAIRAALTQGGTVGAIVATAAGVLGVLCLWGALAPGRTHRRTLTAGRVPLVVDDTVVAGALSRTAGTAASLTRAHVATRLGGRRARISLTPATGFPIDRTAVTRAADDLLTDLGAASRLTARIDIATEGRLS